ncbi:tetratricopeptide repeat protein [candidate division CSSED10-310 bacterium]|uniref:Tetratricopeptide repeat protein n=1 Tax=candidate division CSSED10-310 bacterium TaxID=2855610 RepID=A0ABV6Z1Z8_UNCC1
MFYAKVSALILVFLITLVMVPFSVMGKDILEYGMRAQDHINKKEYDKAIPYLQKATKVNPNNTWIRGMLATSFYQLGRFSEAKSEYEFIAQLEPDNDTASSMITVIEPLMSVEKSKTGLKAAPKIQGKPKETNVVTSQDGQVTCISHKYGFQFSLPKGAWQFADQVRGTYQLKCYRQSPQPTIMLQVKVKYLDKPVLTEDEEKLIVKEYGQSLENLVCRQTFQKRIIRKTRMYLGIFEATVPNQMIPTVLAYRWLVAMKGKRLISVAYSYTKGSSNEHATLSRFIFWNFMPHDLSEQ